MFVSTPVSHILSASQMFFRLLYTPLYALIVKKKTSPESSS